MNDLLSYIDHIDIITESAEFDVMTSLMDVYTKEALIIQEGETWDKVKKHAKDFIEDTKDPVRGKEGESTLKKILMFIPRLIEKLIKMIARALSNLKKHIEECRKKKKQIKDTLKESTNEPSQTEDRSETGEQIQTKDIPTVVELELSYKPNSSGRYGRDYLEQMSMNFKIVQKEIWDRKESRYGRAIPAIEIFLKILDSQATVQKINRYVNNANRIFQIGKYTEEFTAEKINSFVEWLTDESYTLSIEECMTYFKGCLAKIKSMFLDEDERKLPQYSAEQGIGKNRILKQYSPDDVERVMKFVSDIVRKLTSAYNVYWDTKREDLNELERGAKILRGE